MPRPKPLDEYRRERYLTVDEFVALLGVSLRTYYRMQERQPRITTMRHVAEKLGVHPSEVAEFAPIRER